MNVYLAVTLAAALVAAAFLSAIFFFPAAQGNDPGMMRVVQVAITYNGISQTMNAYRASNSMELTNGLMYWKSLGNCNGYGNCGGMLFIIDNSTPTEVCFWMKNTIMPLNMYWISNDTLSYEATNTTPYSTNEICSFGNWVLEPPANISLPVGLAVVIALPKGA